MMEQKLLKMVLFWMLLLCTEFVQSKSVYNVLDKIGKGTCSDQRFSTLIRTLEQTANPIFRDIFVNGGNWCSAIDPLLQAMEPFSECYTAKELKIFKGRNLRFGFQDKGKDTKLINCLMDWLINNKS